MNLISVCVAVSAISFVKCELRYNSAVSSGQNWHHKQLHKDEWKMRENDMWDKRTGMEDTGKDIRMKNKVVEDEQEKEGLGEGKSEFAEGFRQLKHIYDDCKIKANKRLKTLIKAKVKSEISRDLFELKEFVISLYKCMKVFSIRSLDKVLQNDYVPLTDYASFVKDDINSTKDFKMGEKGPLEPIGKNGRTGVRNYASAVLSRDWPTLIYDRLDTLLRSHSLKFHLDQNLTPQGRGRRRDHRMFAMMVMGFMIMASILIPMGFQFLTVLGGKSLLMAKMALIMSAITGLKKIATSNVGYGFYHTGSDGHHHDHIHHGFHEKHFHLNQNTPTQYGFNK